MATNKDAFTTLPPEMRSAIAEQADPHDLLALRLTCRELEVACRDSFTRAVRILTRMPLKVVKIRQIQVEECADDDHLWFYSKRAHLYSCYGLQSLVEITERTHLAKKIQEVDLVCAVLADHNGYCNYGESDRLEACDRKLIRQILKNLQSVGATPAITVSLCPSSHDSGYEETVATYFGLENMRRLLKAHVTEYWTQPRESKSAVDAVLGSISRTGYPIRRLNLCKGATWNGLASLWYRSKDDFLSASTTSTRPFSSLTNLTLLIGQGGITESFLLDLEVFCGHLTALDTLSLTSICGRRYVDGLILARLTDALERSNLQSIELRSLEASAQSYIDVLKNWKASLVRLVLLEANLIHHWSTLLKWCAENLKLDHLQIEGLHKSERVNYAFNYDDESSDGQKLQRTLQDSKPLDCKLDGQSKIIEFLKLVADVPEQFEHDDLVRWEQYRRVIV